MNENKALTNFLFELEFINDIMDMDIYCTDSSIDAGAEYGNNVADERKSRAAQDMRKYLADKEDREFELTLTDYL